MIITSVNIFSLLIILHFNLHTIETIYNLSTEAVLRLPFIFKRSISYTVEQFIVEMSIVARNKKESYLTA